MHPSRADSRRWAVTRRRVFDRDGWRCRSCGRAGRLECDHIVPIRRGGAVWDLDNLQALCVNCHIRKSVGERECQDPERDAWRTLVNEAQSC